MKIDTILYLLLACGPLLSMAVDSSELHTYIVHLQQPDGTVFTSSDDLYSWYHSYLPTATASFDNPRMIHTYTNVVTAFAAQLTELELSNMSAKAGFIHAYPDSLRPLLTTHTPNFLGLQLQKGLWSKSNLGEGIIIGVLDIGIFHNHPSFRGDGMPPPPAKWKGKCEFNASLCNNKLIGARNLVSGLADPSPAPYLTRLPGSSHWVQAPFIGVYRATVKLGNELQLDGESLFQPQAFSSAMYPLVYTGAGAKPDAALCGNDTLNSSDIIGNIVLCEGGRGIARIDKGVNVKKAGGIGMILMNTVDDAFSTLADAHVLPASHVSYLDETKIKAYINSSPDPTATIIFNGTVLGSQAPVITSFSSRGPSIASLGILKPDITGRGVNILAPWPFTLETTKSIAPTFNIISATSCWE